jgi:hypothetical protein
MRNPADRTDVPGGRSVLAAVCEGLAIWCRRTFIVITGIVAIVVLVALAKLALEPKHGAAHYGAFTVRRGLWIWSSVAIGCWLIGVRLAPAALDHISDTLVPRRLSQPEDDSRPHTPDEQSRA